MEGALICVPGRTGSAVLAADTVTVAVESVDVGSDHLNGSLNVGGAIAAAACAVDVASDRHAGTAVVRVALLGFLYSIAMTRMTGALTITFLISSLCVWILLRNVTL